MVTFSLYQDPTKMFDPTQQNITANSTPAVLHVQQPIVQQKPSYTPTQAPTGSVASLQQQPAGGTTSVPAPLTPQQQLDAIRQQALSIQSQIPVSDSTIQKPAQTGSVASIVSGLGYSPEDQAYLDQIDAQNKAQSLATYDPNKTYQEQLALQQARIDSINAIYNDQLNRSRIENAPTYQARLDQSRLQQGLGGYASSAAGTAQSTRQEQANAREQSAAEAVINAQRQAELNAVFGKVDDAVAKAKENFDRLKAEGTASYVSALKEKPKVRAQLVSTAVQSLINSNVDISTLAPEEMKQLTDKLGVSKEALTAEYNSQFATIQAEQAKAQQEQAKQELEMEKTKAQIENLKGEEKQKALDRALEQKKIDVSWYNAVTSRKNAETTAAKAEGSDTQRNYDSKTIPTDLKGSLYSDIMSNANASKKDKKSLNDFIYAYPEIDTKYLTEIYEANQ